MNTLDTHIRSAVSERAAEWFAAHRAGTMSERERAAFFAWLKASPMHVEEYLALMALDGELTSTLGAPAMSVEALVELAEQPGDDIVLPGPTQWGRPALPAISPPAHRGRAWLAAAAFGLTLTALAATWPLLRHVAGTVQYETYQTAHGGQGSWQLPDGSTLQLDTDSAVSLRFSDSERRVTLDRGQAFFTVMHDTRRPFRVAAGSAVVDAVGTQFDVYRHTNRTSITVVEGRVAVSATTPSGTSLGTKLSVGSGEQLTVALEGTAGRPSPIDAVAATAWLHRQIAFDHRPMGEVAEEFNRYNSIPVQVDDAQLRGLPITGVLNVFDLDSFTAFLASFPEVHVQRSNDAIRVTRRVASAAST